MVGSVPTTRPLGVHVRGWACVCDSDAREEEISRSLEDWQACPLPHRYTCTDFRIALAPPVSMASDFRLWM